MVRENRLLAMLPDDVYDTLLPNLAPVELELGQLIAEEGVPQRYAYFPIDAVAAVIIYADDGDSLEVGLIGSEGVVSTSTFLSDGMAPGEIVVQRAGDAMRVPVPALRAAFSTTPPLRTVLLRYTQSFLSQVAQSCACNSMHSIRQRSARWLLMMRDRAGADDFDLSQALLARMLGVGRPSVSLATAELRNAGLVQFTRGRVTIRDREGLKGAACGCYRVITEELERLLQPGSLALD
jgi:CRP-like cAMP-binding protein